VWLAFPLEGSEGSLGSEQRGCPVCSIGVRPFFGAKSRAVLFYLAGTFLGSGRPPDINVDENYIGRTAELKLDGREEADASSRKDSLAEMIGRQTDKGA
jgi:hypothetical protein